MTARHNTCPDPLVDVVAAAKSLVPLILDSRDEGEQIRRVPPRVGSALAAAGLLQMFLPRSMGGPELAPLTVFRAIEEISKADGSVGWCTMIATDASLILGLASRRSRTRVMWSTRQFSLRWLVATARSGISRRWRLSCPRTLEFCQRHRSCQLALLSMYSHGRREAAIDRSGDAKGAGLAASIGSGDD